MLARISVLAAILIVPARATAGEPNLFPQEQITTEQWQTLRTKVKAAPDARDASRPEQPDIEAVEVPEEGTVYYFTTGGPAHPAVIACRSVTFAAIRCEAYFSGPKEEFQKWFASFLHNPPLLPPKPPQ